MTVRWGKEMHGKGCGREDGSEEGEQEDVRRRAREARDNRQTPASLEVRLDYLGPSRR